MSREQLLSLLHKRQTMLTKPKKQRKISTTVYLEEVQDEKLKLISGRTKVPVAEFIRQGIDMILAHNGIKP